MDNIPVYEFFVNPDMQVDEVNMIGFVNQPAIMRNFQHFSSQLEKSVQKFSFINKEERIVYGAAMIPDIKIFRIDNNTQQPYYCYFTSQTIKTIAEDFFNKGYQKNANIEHKPEMRVKDVVFFQSWIKDSAKGIGGLGEDEYADGTWFLGAKVNNDTLWEQITSGAVKGFSIEGVFDMKESGNMLTEEQVYNKIKELLDSIKPV